MKRILVFGVGPSVLLLATLWLVTLHNSSSTLIPEKSPQSFRVASYNVHYISVRREEGDWSIADWYRRKEALNQAVEAIDADIIAFQEMETFGSESQDEVNLTRSWLLLKLPNYTAGAVGDPKTFPSTQPIFYHSNRYELVDQGWFFFSSTPDQIYSKTYNGSYPAFASWVELKEKTAGHTFKVINLHTDFASLNNREQSIDLVVKRIKPWLVADEKVIIAGDFNARLDSSLHQKIEEIGLNFVPTKASTYHFNRGINLFGAIDHIAYSSELSLVSEPMVIQRKFDDEWPTDHYPVAADFVWE